MPKAKNPTSAEKAQALSMHGAELEELRTKLSDRWWRLTSGVLYKIKDKSGNVVPFIPNDAQMEFFRGRHIRNVVLKGRQIGLTTAINIDSLDKSLFSKHRQTGIIAQDLETAADIFKHKLKFAYDNLPEWLREQFPIKTDRQGEIVFASNGSSVSVDTSFRSGTLQHLHITEYGKVCAKNPEKAEEIKSGALNTVSKECAVDIESTAEGSDGDFFDLCQEAMKSEQMGKPLTAMDYKFFFFPWFMAKEYSVEEDVQVSRDVEEYFQKLEADSYIVKRYRGMKFTVGQKRWYQLKKAEQGDTMEREFPSTPSEAFQMAIKGAYYEKELIRCREQNRVGRVLYENRLPVNCAWDLGGAGGGDECAIWFYQQYGREIRVIDFWSGSGYSLVDIVGILKEKGYRYGTDFLPHDAEVHEQTSGKARVDNLRKMGRSCQVLKRMPVSDGINEARNVFPRCWFDEKSCDVGLKHLASYRREWDDRKGGFKDKPFHDRAGHSDAADAFRYMAQSVKDPETNESGAVYVQDWGLGDLLR